MKRIMMVLCVLLDLAVVLVGCGGSGGGGAAVTGGSGTAAGTFTKTVVLTGSDATAAWLFNTDSSNRVMLLYRAGDVRGSGMINSISFRYGATLTSAITCPNVTIKMGHTSVTDLSLVNFDSNVEQGKGSEQPLINNASITIPAGSAGGYYTIPLTQAFNYNGVDNLVVDISRTAACTGNSDVWVHQASPSYRGGSSTGGGYGGLYVPDIRFNFAGGDSAIMYTSAGEDTFPFNSSSPTTSKMQLLYNATEINGSGIITGIAFLVGTSGASSATVTVKLGHTSLTDLTTNFANNFNTGTPVTVANARTFTIPAGIPYGTYVWIPLPDGAFNYNGTDNLVVEIVTSLISGGANWLASSGGGLITQLLGDAANTTGSTYNIQYLIKFRFAGGTMDVNTPAGMTGGLGMFPFTSTDGKIQALYRASELGTKGTITKLSCRSWHNSTADLGFNYTIVMSHTNATTLGSNYAANFLNSVTVYNGTFSIPGTLKGDWFELPLTTPFAYNGSDNLVVQIGGTGGSGTAQAGCLWDNTSTTLYSDRFVTGSNSSATGAVNSGLLDARFTFQ